jgi:uncharacterized protein YjiS (DUF1127 family)
MTTMAFLTQAYNVTFGEILAARFAQIKDAAAKRKVYNKTLNELQSLSMRELADLGLNPSMLRRVAHEAAFGA